MMILIIGGSGSGKSAYAEKAAVTLAANSSLYYLATMQVFGQEGRKKVRRHQVLREGKGFLTIEQPFTVSQAIAKMKAGSKTVLLECMSNLTANEMFSPCGIRKPNEVCNKILNDIDLLKENTKNLVIVSNNVFEDGVLYASETMDYLEALGKINEKLMSAADTVIEVVVGIPIIMKGNLAV